MFNVYLDDSGTSPSHKIAICSALIIPARRIVAMERAWESAKKEEGFTEFHASECAARNKKHPEFSNWDEAKVDRVFRRVAKTATRFGSQAISFAINKSYFDEFISERERETGGQRHYTWAVRRVLSDLREWYAHRQITSPPEYIFDWVEDKAAKEEIERALAQEDSAYPGAYKGHYTFKCREDVPALQCVDLIAWSCFQMSRFIFESTPISEVAMKVLEHMGRFNGEEWIYFYTNDRAQLKEIGGNLSRDSTGRQLRHDWYVKYRAQIEAQNPQPKRKPQKL